MKMQDGFLYTVLCAVANTLHVSIAWLLTSLPLVTIALSSACAGGALRRTVLTQEAHPLRIYFSIWRESWRRLLPVGAVYVPLILIMAFLRMAAQQFVPALWWLRALYDGIMLVSAACLIWGSALADASLSAGKTIAACLVFTGKHLFTTLTALLSVALGCALVRVCLPLALLVPGAVSALLTGMLAPKAELLLKESEQRSNR